MNAFDYRYPVTVHFGEGAARRNLPSALQKVGRNVLLAYGGGSIRKNGIYEELTGILTEAGKHIVEFTGIMSNPTYEKVQEAIKFRQVYMAPHCHGTDLGALVRYSFGL